MIVIGAGSWWPRRRGPADAFSPGAPCPRRPTEYYRAIEPPGSRPRPSRSTLRRPQRGRGSFRWATAMAAPTPTTGSRICSVRTCTAPTRSSRSSSTSPPATPCRWEPQGGQFGSRSANRSGRSAFRSGDGARVWIFELPVGGDQRGGRYNSMKVDDVMTRAVVSLRPAYSRRQVVDLLIGHRFNAVPVVDVWQHVTGGDLGGGSRLQDRVRERRAA